MPYVGHGWHLKVPAKKWKAWVSAKTGQGLVHVEQILWAGVRRYGGGCPQHVVPAFWTTQVSQINGHIVWFLWLTTWGLGLNKAAFTCGIFQSLGSVFQHTNTYSRLNILLEFTLGQFSAVFSAWISESIFYSIISDAPSSVYIAPRLPHTIIYLARLTSYPFVHSLDSLETCPPQIYFKQRSILHFRWQ